MKNVAQIMRGIPIFEALEQIERHPELWGENVARTEGGSPHRESLDIWLRFRELSELKEPINYGEPHFAVWYPAAEALPALRPIIFSVMSKVGAVYLGGVLLTRVPAGKKIHPHHDRGSWHAEYLNCKVYIILSANEKCVNRYEDEAVTMRAGEAWAFNNQVTHSVENNGDGDRIALIITMRVE